MDSARKIELQAPEDLAYLIANVRRAATARIDEAFPPVDDSTEDELRTRIEEQVNEYIIKTFSLAAPNLTINGLPVDPSQFLSEASLTTSSEPEEVFEPFDARKRARVEALTAEEEDLLRDIARLKKSVPGAVAGAWAEAARKGVKEDEEALEKVNALATAQFEKPTPPSDSDTDGKKAAASSSNVLAITPLERQDDVETSFDDAVRGLGRLKKEMPAVVARMERARKAGEYVITER
ncbi:hypothetical protein F5B22DRAFT_623407 [Xylaria bambusicola]|uniref:uncharacterized protein n=1 Tax=Xylaria bambusicola TaxID=326684 RepID=UPI0020082EC8|nr:uncharacterized protein F5B22DRAFT_623407 [Xylaria bambusicola]KAI0506534.1 hypothetical protein F5B22DRAFT_623407 [Xylaria bambusicola]